MTRGLRARRTSLALLDDLSEPAQKRTRVRTVERTMVEAQAQVADRRNPQAVPAVGDHPLRHPVGRDDPHLGRVQDRERHPGAGRARVRDRERAAGEVVGPELLRPRPRPDVADRRREIGEPHPVGVADDGHDQPLKVEIDRDPEPDRAVDDERVAADGRVEERERAQRVDDRAGDEGQRREPGCRPGPLDVRVVGGDGDERVRGRALRSEQRRGGSATHVVERNDLVGRRRALGERAADRR